MVWRKRTLMQAQRLTTIFEMMSGTALCQKPECTQSTLSCPHMQSREDLIIQSLSILLNVAANLFFARLTVEQKKNETEGRRWKLFFFFF
jgi:hypothetical protein